MNNNNNNIVYPDLRRDEGKVNVYHKNIQIKDPYHYLEDASNPETQQFVSNQTNLLKNALGYTKNQEIIFSIISKLNREQTNISYLSRFLGKYLYVVKEPTSEGENYAKVYLQDLRDGHGIPSVLIDPNSFSDPERHSLEETEFYFSNDGLYLCYMINMHDGWKNLLFIDLLRGHRCEDRLEKVKFTTIGWTKFRDEYGLFYACYPTLTDRKGKSPQSGYTQKLLYHKLGTNQTDDIVIVDPTDPREMMPSYVTPDGEILVILKQLDCSSGNQVYFLKLRPWFESGKKAKPELVCVIGNNMNRFNYITSNANLVYFHTTHGTISKTNSSTQWDTNRIVGINFQDGQFSNESNWKEIIGPSKGQLLISCIVAHKKYLVVWYSNLGAIGSFKLSLYTIDGALVRNYKFDNITISFINGNYWSSEVFLKVENLSCAGKVYRIDLSQKHVTSNLANRNFFTSCCCAFPEVHPLKLFKDVKYPDSENDHFVNYSISCKSKDGTVNIPILLCHDKNLTKGSKASCLLHVYGSYGYQMSPTFSVRNLAFMKYLGGVIAIACVRGGGELGSKWHKAGVGSNKQNSVDDCISVAQELIKQKYTIADRLCITGLEAGGTLIGIVINQKPELFGAAVAISPCMDLLRLGQNIHTATMIQEYGNPEVPKDFEHLQKLSPLQTLKTKTSLKDKQVFPSVYLTVNNNTTSYASTFKYLAELQNLFCDTKRRPLHGKLHLIEISDQGTSEAEMEDKQSNSQEEKDINFLTFACETFGIALDKKEKKVKRLSKYKRKIV